jgi:hypothetical protein
MASPEQDDTADSSTLRTAELHLIGGAPQRCLDTWAEAAPSTSAEGAFDRGLLLARALADTGNYPAAAEIATNLAAGSDPVVAGSAMARSVTQIRNDSSVERIGPPHARK